MGVTWVRGDAAGKCGGHAAEERRPCFFIGIEMSQPRGWMQVRRVC